MIESDKLRRDAADLQALARRLMDEAQKLITASMELKKKIDGHSKKASAQK